MQDNEDKQDDGSVTGKLFDAVGKEIKEHPVRTAAVVATVGIGGWLLARLLKKARRKSGTGGTGGTGKA